MTAIELITRAYRLVNIIDENEVPSAEQGVEGLATLNDLIGQWDRDGIELGWQVVTDLDETLPLESQDRRAVHFNLATELAGEFGIDPLPRVQRIASQTYDQLSKAHRKQVESKYDLVPAEDAYYWWDAIDTGGF